ncbi:MAG: hypothetical protein EBZ48_01950 [Proteobacteria bacterium]|nr:hypothetical protein [Pseudomonadota bacterium]
MGSMASKGDKKSAELKGVEPSIPAGLHKIVEAGAKVSQEVDGAVALGGTVCAPYANHRLSVDIDFVLSDLRSRFDQVREHLLEVPGWTEASARPPVLILDSFNCIEVGLRQLRRNTKMQTQVVTTSAGPLTIPTLDELLCTKAFLLYQRGYTRDFADFAELSVLMTDDKVVATLTELDKRFAWEKQPSVMLGVLKALLCPAPVDLNTHGYETLRWVSPRLHSWNEVRECCVKLGEKLAVKIG